MPTTATDYPVNDGSFRNLKVIMPMGRVISAERPFPMRVWMTYPMTVIDTVFKAFAKAIPDRTIAGHHADLVFPKHSRHLSCRWQIVYRRNWPTGRGLGCEKE